MKDTKLVPAVQIGRRAVNLARPAAFFAGIGVITTVFAGVLALSYLFGEALKMATPILRAAIPPFVAVGSAPAAAPADTFDTEIVFLIDDSYSMEDPLKTMRAALDQRVKDGTVAWHLDYRLVTYPAADACPDSRAYCGPSYVMTPMYAHELYWRMQYISADGGGTEFTYDVLHDVIENTPPHRTFILVTDEMPESRTGIDAAHVCEDLRSQGDDLIVLTHRAFFRDWLCARTYPLSRAAFSFMFSL